MYVRGFKIVISPSEYSSHSPLYGKLLDSIRPPSVVIETPVLSTYVALSVIAPTTCKENGICVGRITSAFAA